MAHFTAESEAQPTALTVPLFEKDLVTVEAISIDNDIEIATINALEESDTGHRTVGIRVFDPDVEPAAKDFALSILDCIMPRIYVPVTCTYQLDEQADTEAILSSICEGLRRLMGDYPFLAGGLLEPEDGGRAFVRCTPSHADFQVHIQDVTISDPKFPSFIELKERHFPPSQLEGMVRLPSTESSASNAEHGVPVMVVQLNIIRGGLVVSYAVHHMLLDGLGLDRLLVRWAAHTRSIVDPGLYSPPSPLEARDLDTSILAKAVSHTRKDPQDYRKQAVASLKYAPDGWSPPKISLAAIDQHILHIPASKLAMLKASAAPVPGNEDQRWVSTNDCIAALMWRATTRSRLTAHGIDAPQDDARVVALENSLNARSAFDGSGGVPDAYLGNVVMFSRAEMPLWQLVAPDTFRAAALKARAAVEQFRSWPTVERAIEWIEACPQPAYVEMDVEAVGGLDAITTSWRVFKAYEQGDFGFGPLMGLRWIAHVIEGCSVLYPTRLSGDEDEGVEIFIGLEQGCMKRLLLDEELTRWASLRN